MRYWLSRFTPLASGWQIVIQLPLDARAAAKVFLGSVQAGWEPNVEDGNYEARWRHREAKWLLHSPGQRENQGKIQDSDQRHVYMQTFCILKGQSWKAIIPTEQQLVGVQHPTRWLFTFCELQCDLRAIFWVFVAEITGVFLILFSLSPNAVNIFSQP